MSVDALERRLQEAAAQYVFPPTPDLAGAARARLAAPPRRSRRRLAVALVATAVAVCAGVLALSPGARSAVVDLLDRVPGISIERAPELPKTRYVATPDYGAPVDLAQAERLFGRPLRLPEDVGEPDRLFWLAYPPGDMITAVYGDEREARLVFSQWKVGATDLFQKVLGFGTAARLVTVDGAPGIWIFGTDHGVFYLRPGERDGPTAMHYRAEGYLAGNVLAWQREGISYRLEADVPFEDALELARSLDVAR